METNTTEAQALPPGWQEMLDDSGKLYYADHATRTTSRERPEAQKGDLPLGWEMLRNEDGVAYLADHNTHTATFTDPRSM
jgi:hypothetical protein